MAKTNRFPLEMEDGIFVNNLGELKAHFSLEKVQGYVEDGSLAEWLEARYESDLAESVRALDVYRSDFAENLCKLFDVAYADAEEKSAEAQIRKEKRERLMAYGADRHFFDVIDSIAFTQEDLYDLLDDDVSPLYLCGETFEIPINKRGVSYIGVNEPTVVIHSKKFIQWEEREISFTNVRFDEQYQAIVLSHAPCGAPKEGLEKEYIGKKIVIHRGEEKTYKNKRVELYDCIECAGTLRFENCYIEVHRSIECTGSVSFINCTLQWSDSFRNIEIKNGSAFTMSNCIIEATDPSVSNDNDRCLLFLIDEGPDITVTNCRFINCANTFRVTNRNISFNNCYVQNPGAWLIHNYSESCVTIINHSSFFFDDDLWYTGKGSRAVIEGWNIAFEQCIFDGSKYSKENPPKNFAQSTNCAIINATFTHFPRTMHLSGVIEKCMFVDCNDILGLHHLSTANGWEAMAGGTLYIKESRFEACKNIFSFTMGEVANFTYCQFNDCEGLLTPAIDRASINIENCEFNNWKICSGQKTSYPEPMISLEEGCVTNCTFNGIRADNSYLIKTSNEVSLSTCRFINCRTWDTSDQLLNGSFDIIDCIGLDKVNKEPDVRAVYTPMTHATDGTPIGVTVELNIP